MIITSIFPTTVPLWVSISFLISFLAPIFLIRYVIKQAATNANYTPERIAKLTNATTIFFFAFYIVVSIASFTSFFKVNSLPPRILLATALPLLLFYFLIIFRSKTYWKLLEKSKLSSLVRIHIFRLVGVFFLINLYFETLPKEFALVGGIGDIFAAVTAIFVAKMIDNKHKHYKKATLIWNIIGFWDIVSVIITGIYITKKSLETGGQDILEFTVFPFSLIPALAPATIIFLHITIFKKLKMEE